MIIEGKLLYIILYDKQLDVERNIQIERDISEKMGEYYESWDF